MTRADLAGDLTHDIRFGMPQELADKVARAVCNNNDCVDVREFCLGMACLTPYATRTSKLDFIFKMYDADGDGYLNREECRLLMRDTLLADVTTISLYYNDPGNEHVLGMVDVLFHHVADFRASSVIDLMEFRQLADPAGLAAGIAGEVLLLLSRGAGRRRTFRAWYSTF